MEVVIEEQLKYQLEAQESLQSYFLGRVVRYIKRLIMFLPSTKKKNMVKIIRAKEIINLVVSLTATVAPETNTLDTFLEVSIT
jgi:hypothetical protein